MRTSYFQPSRVAFWLFALPVVVAGTPVLARRLYLGRTCS